MVGTPAWTRTKDQLIKSQLLYQLSYRGMGWVAFKDLKIQLASLGEFGIGALGTEQVEFFQR